MEIINNQTASDKDNDEHFMIKDKDTGKVFDLRNHNDYEKINENLEMLSNYYLKEEDKKFHIEYYKLSQKIKTKFFKACERGDALKIKKLLDKRKSPDMIAPINEKYMHGYSVLHVAVSNSKFTFLILF